MIGTKAELICFKNIIIHFMIMFNMLMKLFLNYSFLIAIHSIVNFSKLTFSGSIFHAHYFNFVSLLAEVTQLIRNSNRRRKGKKPMKKIFNVWEGCIGWGPSLEFDSTSKMLLASLLVILIVSAETNKLVPWCHSFQDHHLWITLR